MLNDLLPSMKSLLPNVVIDKSFLKRIEAFNYRWLFKNDDHIEFFGGATIGVQTVRFSKLDDNIFYDTFDIDFKSVEAGILKIKSIDHKRQVSSNPHYLILIYFMYLTLHAEKLSDKEKKAIIEQLYYTFAYRVISGRMVHYFPYPLDPNIAKTVLEKLSNRYILKKCGSWNKMLEYRAKDILPGGLHYKALDKFDPDKVQYIIADLYNRLKDVFKNIYPIIIQVKENKEAIGTTSSTAQIGDDDEHYSDDMVSSGQYVDYIKSIIFDQGTLIRYELVTVVAKRVGKITPDDLLRSISNLKEIEPKPLYTVLEEIIPNTLDFLYRKGITSNYTRNIFSIVNMLKGYLLANKVKHKAVLLVKDLFLDYVPTIYQKRPSNTVINHCMVATVVYLIIRSFYKD